MAAEDSAQWYWCLRHKRAELEGDACGAQLRMGPYPSQAAAERYAEIAESREETWEAEDERWEGR